MQLIKGKRIILVLDNSKSHKTDKTVRKARELKITFVFLPPYSPDLNLVKFVWKTRKREVSVRFIQSKEHLKIVSKMNLRKWKSHYHLQRNGWKLSTYK